MAEAHPTQVPSIPFILNDLIAVNVRYKVLICLGNGCRCAINPASGVAHLRRKHSTPIELRRQVERYLEQCQFDEYTYSTVELPADGLAPQQIIPIVNGYQCKHCTHKSRNRLEIREHANKVHDKKRVRDEELFDPVRLQSWFWKGKERYWVVEESDKPSWPLQSEVVSPASHQPDDSQDDSGSQSEVEDQIVRDIEAKIAAEKEQRLRLLARTPTVEADPWLRFTGWNAVLNKSKHNIIKTHEFIREPDATEPELTRVLQAWERVLDRCLDTLAATNHKDTLKWWASPKNEASSPRPFELPQNAKTIDKYSGYWQHFICYAMRTAPQEGWEEETETGVKYSEEQWQCIDWMRTILQVDGPDDEFTEEKERDYELTTELMRFCMLMVMQDTSRFNSVYDSPLMHYLAVRGVDTHTKAFRSSFFYTPILAGVLYMNRLVMLEVAVPIEGWRELQLANKDEIDSIPDRIHQIRQQHLCEGSFSPTSSILGQLAMGKSFNRLHQSPSNIHWSEGGRTIHYMGEGVEMAKIEVMCQELIKDLGMILDELVFGSKVADIDLGQIIDSMSWSQEFRRDDYSFIQHPKNKVQVDFGYRLLLKKARKAVGEWQMIKRGIDGEMHWIDHRVKAYLVQEKGFLKKLMVACHVTGGQPARGPELGSIKVSNSIYSARNLYVMNGRMCFLTTYDKAQRRRGNTEYIVRFLPDEVSQILAKYLVYVRPFARVLEKVRPSTQLSDQRESEYLFNDERGPWAGEELTRELSDTTTKHLGVRLTVSGWRHVAIGIAVRHLMRIGKMWEDDKTEEEEDDFAEGEDDDELELATFQHIVIRQSGHGARVARSHYAIDGAFLHRLGPELLTVYEQASVAWHGLLGLKSEGAGGSPAGIRRRAASQQLMPGSAKRLKPWSNASSNSCNSPQPSSHPFSSPPIPRESRSPQIIQDRAMTALKKLFGPKGRPQSEGQASALQLVHQPPRTSIIVLPTSSGKSVLFFSVAAMTEQQTVIVVSPFAQLVDDMVDRGKKSGLQCEEWTHGDFSGELQQLVIVSADRAVSGEFLHYAKGLELNGQLAHVFFDECHVALTDTSYRERLRELWKLRRLECPFTCLTATLMVELEGTLRDRLLIEHAYLFRRSTARRSIRYSVQDSGDEQPSVVGIRTIQALTLPAQKKGVIYVRSYATGEVISSTLKCPFYKAHAHEKGQMLKDWIEANASDDGGNVSPWIVATGALGTGINIEGIIYVVHIDRPYGLTSFAQQSGRGGRNGEVSDSIIIVRSKTTRGRRRKEVLSAYSIEDIDEAAMTEFIQSKTCRRKVLAKYLDGESIQVDCRSIDGVNCDWCKVHIRPARADARLGISEAVEGREEESGQREGSRAIAARLNQMMQANEELIQVMNQLHRRCIFCVFTSTEGEGDEGPHVYEGCVESFFHQCGHEEYSKWRQGVRFCADYLQCFHCGLSQEICRRKEENRKVCEYEDMMLPGIFVLHKKGYLSFIVSRVGFQGEYSEDLWEWMSGTAEGFGSIVESNWMKTWREVCRTYSEIKSGLE